MPKFPIYLDHNTTQMPIGWVEINDKDFPDEVMNECAIIPHLRKENGEAHFITSSFGLVKRTTVDTRPREL